MNAMDVLTKAREGMTLRTVFGEPIMHDGMVIIPVAKIAGGAGGGSGQDTSGATPSGEGAGFGIRSAPVGVFVVKDGAVTWRPAMDLNKVILGGQIVGIVALLTIGSIVRAVIKRRTGSDQRSG
jgi:uncharacterized spore protein YtfJ